VNRRRQPWRLGHLCVAPGGGAALGEEILGVSGQHAGRGRAGSLHDRGALDVVGRDVLRSCAERALNLWMHEGSLSLPWQRRTALAHLRLQVWRRGAWRSLQVRCQRRNIVCTVAGLIIGWLAGWTDRGLLRSPRRTSQRRVTRRTETRRGGRNIAREVPAWARTFPTEAVYRVRHARLCLLAQDRATVVAARLPGLLRRSPAGMPVGNV
jgi:hypothetical protein